MDMFDGFYYTPGWGALMTLVGTLGGVLVTSAIQASASRRHIAAERDKWNRDFDSQIDTEWRAEVAQLTTNVIEVFAVGPGFINVILELRGDVPPVAASELPTQELRKLALDREAELFRLIREAMVCVDRLRMSAGGAKRLAQVLVIRALLTSLLTTSTEAKWAVLRREESNWDGLPKYRQAVTELQVSCDHLVDLTLADLDRPKRKQVKRRFRAAHWSDNEPKRDVFVAPLAREHLKKWVEAELKQDLGPSGKHADKGERPTS